MTTRLTAAALWAGLLAFSVFIAPPPHPELGPWVVKLLLGRWDGENTLLVAIFNAMGLLPVMVACVLRDDLRRRPVPAWPFVVGSMVVGIFALLPWIALRDEGPSLPLRPTLQRLLGGRALPLAGLVMLGGLAGWAAMTADVAGYLQLVSTEQFTAVMSVDFLFIHAFIAGMLWERDARGWELALVPFIGPPLAIIRSRTPTRSDAEPAS